MTDVTVVAATTGSDRVTHAVSDRPVHAATIRAARTTGQNCVAGTATKGRDARARGAGDQGQSSNKTSTGPGVQYA